jgi:hypothetical protein
MARTGKPAGTQLYERIVGTTAGAICLGLIIFLVVRNQPFADPTLALLTRVIVSLVAAVFGATLPGFLNLQWNAGGLGLRAGGALALFVLTFLVTPQVISPNGCVNGVQIGSDGKPTTQQTCGTPSQVADTVLDSLRKTRLALQEMQDAKVEGLGFFLDRYSSDPSAENWAPVPEAAGQVHDLLKKALAVVGQYQSYMKVELGETPRITEQLYGRLPLILKLEAQKDPPGAEDARASLEELGALNAAMQQELDALEQQVKARTTT